MEAFSTLLALCEGNPSVTGGFPHKGQWRGALVFYLIGARNKRLSKQSRRYHANCDVTVMVIEWKEPWRTWVKSTGTKPRQNKSLRWGHNGHDGVSNPQPHHCLLNRLFMCRSKKTSCGVFADDRWIPRTNGQQREKCFHLMTSSYLNHVHTAYDIPRQLCKPSWSGITGSELQWIS